nr:MAG TPA: hypothetical protein [Caudoviricetes sp.]
MLFMYFFKVLSFIFNMFASSFLSTLIIISSYLYILIIV